MTSPSDSELPDSGPPSGSDELPAVLVIRDPDGSDDILLYGLPADVHVISLDLGASFDVSHPRHWDRPTVSEWVMAQLGDASALPVGHGARDVVEETIAVVCEKFGLAPDGSLID